MSTHSITIKPTNNEAIIKFESNQFLVKNQSYEFNNIDQAKPSPLAQQLFYLPFVKTVYMAQNFIAIERFDIITWPDVQDEVKDQIEQYLNSDNPLITIEQTTKTPVTVYAEATPNPGVMKFVANKKLVINDTEFKSIADTVDNTLSRKLYQQFPYIKEIYASENYLSIHKHEITTWEEITRELRSYIKESIENGAEVGQSNHKAGTTKSESEQLDLPKFENLDDVSKKVIDILDEYIKPAVASDGGNIVFDSYNETNKEVNVILQGACSGCPSSTLTLKNGIETMLREMLPGKIDKVIAING